jgi:Uma2 family endonuclease
MLVVIEVSSTTLRFDRNVKVPMYARHAIPEVWVLDVSGEQIDRYRSPRRGQYTSTTIVPFATRMPLDSLGCEIGLHSLAGLLAESQTG